MFRNLTFFIVFILDLSSVFLPVSLHNTGYGSFSFISCFDIYFSGIYLYLDV